MTTQEELDLNTSIAIIGIKLKALRLSMSEEQLKIYNGLIEDELERFEPILQVSYQDDPAKISSLLEACRN